MEAAYHHLIRSPETERNFDLLCQFLNFGDGFDNHTRHLVLAFLDGDFIKPFFYEYTRDYLMPSSEIEDIELEDLQTCCHKKNAFHNWKYTGHSLPDKKDWMPLDHATRFVVQTLQFSWKHGGIWSYCEWDPESDDESDVEFWQVWLILRWLQSQWEASNMDNWNEDSLEDMFSQLQLSKL